MMNTLLYSLSNDYDRLPLDHSLIDLLKKEGWYLTTFEQGEFTLYGYHAIPGYHQHLANPRLFLQVDGKDSLLVQDVLLFISEHFSKHDSPVLSYALQNPYANNMWWDGHHRFRLCFTADTPVSFNPGEAFEQVLGWVQSLVEVSGFQQKGSAFLYEDQTTGLQKALLLERPAHHREDHWAFSFTAQVQPLPVSMLQPPCTAKRGSLSKPFLHGGYTLHPSTDIALLKTQVKEEVLILLKVLLPITSMENARAIWQPAPKGAIH